MMHLCLARYRGGVVAVCGWSPSGSALDAAAAAELVAEAAFEIHEAAEAEQPLDVLLAVEGAEHAGEVVSRCDLRAQASAERLAVGAAAEVEPAFARCRNLGCAELSLRALVQLRLRGLQLTMGFEEGDEAALASERFAQARADMLDEATQIGSVGC
jgi:hypothetical protein